MSYSLIIPIYNEEYALKDLLLELETLPDIIEVIIINDGSTDNSKKILSFQKHIKVLHNPINMGKGFSIINAIEFVSNQNIILMDGDLEIDIESIPRLIKEFELNDNHVIVGSRWNEKSNPGKNINTYGNYLINYIFNFLYGTSLTDVLCCVKIMNKDLFKDLMLSSKGFNIEMEIMTKLAIKKIKILEKKVIYDRRPKYKGKKLKISDGWGIVGEMLKNKIL
jgi:dolichol-phosphate hexosyltransferase